MSFRFFRLILILALVALAPQSFGAMAQGLGQAPAGLVADQQKILQGLTTKTDDLEKKVQDDGVDDTTLVEIRLQLEELSRGALNSALAFRSRLGEINARVEQLGAPPATNPPAADGYRRGMHRPGRPAVISSRDRRSWPSGPG